MIHSISKPKSKCAPKQNKTIFTIGKKENQRLISDFFNLERIRNEDITIGSFAQEAIEV